MSIQQTSEIYHRLFRYLKKYKSRFAVALVAMIAYGTTDGVVPLLIRAVSDEIFGKQDRQMLMVLPFVLVAFALFRGIAGFVQHYLSASVGLSIVQDIRNEIHSKLLTLSPSFFFRYPTGSLVSRMTNDSLLVRTALTEAATTLLRDSMRTVALLIAALYLDPLLGLIVFFSFPLGLVPVIRYGKKIRRLSRVGQDHFGGLTSTLQETIGGFGVIQSFTMEPFEEMRFRRENEKLTEIFLKAEKYGALSGPTNELLASLAIAAVVLYGGFRVMSGVRTQGDFIAFLTAMFLLYEPLKKLGRVNGMIQSGLAAAGRIFEIFDAQPDIVDKLEAVELTGPMRIDYVNVSFHYGANHGALDRVSHNGSRQDAAFHTGKKEEHWALRDISLVVEPGEKLALVGMSGGGKSTLVSLLPRFYDPQVGSLRIGGRDIRDFTLKSLRRNISVVSQHTFLFNDTVFHNIAYGRQDATKEQIFEAAHAANADGFIKKLPAGYETIIGEQGLRLSGGERTRMAIARALLKNAPILILDEATASLDSESERFVQEAIDRLIEHRTVLVIAHRLSTVRKADKIAVLVGGRIVEIGNHRELLARSGEYAKLYRIQFEEQDKKGSNGKISQSST